MKNLRFLFLFAVAGCLLSRGALAVTIPASLTEPTRIDLSDLSQNNKYRVNISQMVAPKKMTGNPFRDSTLAVSCGDNALATDSKRIVPSDFGKVVKFSVSFDFDSSECESFLLDVKLEVNGITIDSPVLEYSVATLAETESFFMARVRSELTTRTQDLVYYHGEMSKSAGSRQSLHCLIAGYETDPSLDAIISDLKVSYKKLFGMDYVVTDINCDSAPTLASEVATCSISPQTNRQFCSFYTLYSQTLAWFHDSVEQANFQKTLLIEGDNDLAQALDSLIRDINADKSASLSQLADGANP